MSQSERIQAAAEALLSLAKTDKVRGVRSVFADAHDVQATETTLMSVALIVEDLVSHIVNDLAMATGDILIRQNECDGAVIAAFDDWILAELRRARLCEKVL